MSETPNATQPESVTWRRTDRRRGPLAARKVAVSCSGRPGEWDMVATCADGASVELVRRGLVVVDKETLAAWLTAAGFEIEERS